MVRFNTGKKFTISICNFDLFLIAKKYIFVIIVHKMNGVDGLIIGRPNWEKFPIVSDVHNIQGWTLPDSHQETTWIAFNLSYCWGGLYFAYSFSFSEIKDLELISSAC